MSYKKLLVLLFFVYYQPILANNIEQALTDYLDNYHKKTPLNCSILVAQNNKIIYMNGFGFANKENGIKNTEQTQHLIGSLTKVFTAAAVLKLVEQGQLKLTNTVAYYLPENHELWQGKMPKWANTVTIHHLLTHTAGLAEYVTLEEFEKFYEKPHTTHELVRFFAYAPVKFNAGESYEYSGSGYNLLGALIEIVSGKSYSTFLEEEFFKPLNMLNTYSPHTMMLSQVQKINPALSTGYVVEEEKLVPAGEVNLTTAFAEASIISTVIDLWRWQEALYNGKVLKTNTLEAMLTPYQQISDSDTWVGYGIFIDKAADGKIIYEHTGRINGYDSIMLYDPTTKTSVIMLSNVMDGTAFAVAYTLLDIAQETSSNLCYGILLFISMALLPFCLTIFYLKRG